MYKKKKNYCEITVVQRKETIKKDATLKKNYFKKIKSL